MGHAAVWQLTAEGMIAIGRLNPFTTDTVTPQHTRFCHHQSFQNIGKPHTIIVVEISVTRESPLRHCHRPCALHGVN
jgi:hypothetical protein